MVRDEAPGGLWDVWLIEGVEMVGWLLDDIFCRRSQLDSADLAWMSWRGYGGRDLTSRIELIH